jgi:hypothetical protein
MMGEENVPSSGSSGAPSAAQTRDSLNGCWILDKTVGDWSMNKYLETMQVDPLAIEAHDKADKENDTFHTIELDSKQVKITKRSRVNNDVVVQLELGKEQTEFLPPGNRPKRTLARSEGPMHLEIQSSLQTMNGKASVSDIKRLKTINDKTYLVQELSIINEGTQQSCTTTRYFIPYLQTPPHLVES